MKQVAICVFLLQNFAILVLANLPFHVKAPSVTLNEDSLAKWVGEHHLSLVLFCNKEMLDADPGPASFVERFEILGKLLNLHKVYFGVYDCIDGAWNEHCAVEEDPVELAVYYKGSYLMNVAAYSLYDDDSILSNALQLSLIRDVDLIQTDSDLKQKMETAVTKGNDFLIMFVKGIGTEDHAEYMLAASYITWFEKVNVQLAHSTEMKILKNYPQNLMPSESLANELNVNAHDSQLYYFKCSDVTLTANGMCPVYHYMGRMQHENIGRYAHVLSSNLQVEEAIKLHMPVVSCLYNSESKSAVEKLTNELSEEMMGSARFYSLDVKDANKGDAMMFEGAGPGCSVVAPEDEFTGYSPVDKIRDILVNKWLKNNVHVKREREDPGPQKELTGDAFLDGLDDLIAAVETQDDSVAIEDRDKYGGRTQMDLSHLHVLTRDTFEPKQHSGLVLFHLNKYDHYSRFAVRVYNATAVKLPEHKFSLLNCYDWTDVCKKINVTRYPTVKMYSSGRGYDYNGPFSTDGFRNLALFSQFQAPHKMNSMSDLMTMRKTFVATNLNTNVIIGLFHDDKSKEHTAFRRAARYLVGQKLMAVATGELAGKLRDMFSLPDLPVVLSYKPSESDASKALKVFDKPPITKAAIEEFALRVSLPSFVELTPETLPLVYKSTRPQLMLFIDDVTSEPYTVLEELSKDTSLQNEFSFSYLILKDNPLNKRILTSLSKSATSPVLIIADYSKGQVFESEDKDMKAESITKWLDNISTGSVEPTKLLPDTEWKPQHPGYDFLTMIELDKKRAQAKYEREHFVPSKPQETSKDLPNAKPLAEAPTSTESTDRTPTHTEL